MAAGGEVPVDLRDVPDPGSEIVENGLEGGDEEEVETNTSIDTSEIERDLDTLTLSGSTINDLELKLTRTRELYRRTLDESRQKLEALRKKLNTHIVKAEPFVELWRRARQVQEVSNCAAARYDKASSQHAAAREMIRVAEEKLATSKRDASALDLAWQEMLNHSTARVVETEREKRDSEDEHKLVLQECQVVMEDYKNTEWRLRSHIVKSRPFYEERYKCNQRLQALKRYLTDLEAKIKTSKDTYTKTLKKLETLNAQIHERRRSSSVRTAKLHKSEVERQRSSSALNLVARKSHLIQEWEGGKERRAASANSTPEMRQKKLPSRDGRLSNAESLESLQLGDMKNQFTGSTGSLPSIGTSSVSDYCPTPDPGSNAGENPEIKDDQSQSAPEPLLPRHGETPAINGDNHECSAIQLSAPVIKVSSPNDGGAVAQDLVAKVLVSAAAKLENQMTNPPSVTH